MLQSWPAREQHHEPPRRCCVAPCGKPPWTAMRLQWAATAVTHAGHIQECLAVIDQPARGGERSAGWADVHVPLLVERKIIPTEGPVLALRLVDHRDVRGNLLAVDEPVEVCPRPVGGIGREPLGFDIEALLGPLDHGFRRPDLSLADGT